jgi:hypothetical protein
MSSLHRTFARRIQRAGYQQPRRPSTVRGHKPDTVRTMPELHVLRPASKEVLKSWFRGVLGEIA